MERKRKVNGKEEKRIIWRWRGKKPQTTKLHIEQTSVCVWARQKKTENSKRTSSVFPLHLHSSQNKKETAQFTVFYVTLCMYVWCAVRELLKIRWKKVQHHTSNQSAASEHTHTEGMGEEESETENVEKTTTSKMANETTVTNEMKNP